MVNSEWLEGSFGNDYGIFPLSHCIALKLAPTSDPFGVSILNEQEYQIILNTWVAEQRAGTLHINWVQVS